MLDTGTFPYPGSTALLDGELVRVHQHLDRETALVFGKRERRVPIAQLAPPPAKTLFQHWLAEHVIPASLAAPDAASVFTPAADAAQAYRDWLATQTGDQVFPASDYSFIKMMERAGHRVVRGLWRADGDTHVRTRVLYPFALRSAA